MTATTVLRNVGIFQELEDGELEELARVSKEERFPSGTYVFREGEAGDRLYLLVDGEVRISRTVPSGAEEALTVLKPGAMFGEMAVFDRNQRSTDAVALRDVVALTITRADFEMVLEANRELAYKVLWAVVRTLSDRLRATNDSLRSLWSVSMF